MLYIVERTKRMSLVGLSTRKASVPGGTRMRILGTQDLNPLAKSIRNSFYSLFPIISTLSLKLLIVITMNIVLCFFFFLKVETFSQIFTFSNVELTLNSSIHFIIDPSDEL